MKAVIFNLIITTATMANAMQWTAPASSDFPSEQGWAKAIISMACGISTDSLKAMEVTVTKNSLQQPVYTASTKGVVVAKAVVSSSNIWAKKVCLVK